MFHMWAALRAASVRSAGLLYSKDAVWAPQSKHMAYQHQPFSSSSRPTPPQ